MFSLLLQPEACHFMLVMVSARPSPLKHPSCFQQNQPQPESALHLTIRSVSLQYDFPSTYNMERKKGIFLSRLTKHVRIALPNDSVIISPPLCSSSRSQKLACSAYTVTSKTPVPFPGASSSFSSSSPLTHSLHFGFCIPSYLMAGSAGFGLLQLSVGRADGAGPLPSSNLNLPGEISEAFIYAGTIPSGLLHLHPKGSLKSSLFKGGKCAVRCGHKLS